MRERDRERKRERKTEREGERWRELLTPFLLTVEQHNTTTLIDLTPLLSPSFLASLSLTESLSLHISLNPSPDRSLSLSDTALLLFPSSHHPDASLRPRIVHGHPRPSLSPSSLSFSLSHNQPWTLEYIRSHSIPPSFNTSLERDGLISPPLSFSTKKPFSPSLPGYIQEDIEREQLGEAYWEDVHVERERDLDSRWIFLSDWKYSLSLPSLTSLSSSLSPISPSLSPTSFSEAGEVHLTLNEIDTVFAVVLNEEVLIGSKGEDGSIQPDLSYPYNQHTPHTLSLPLSLFVDDEKREEEEEGKRENEREREQTRKREKDTPASNTLSLFLFSPLPYGRSLASAYKYPVWHQQLEYPEPYWNFIRKTASHFGYIFYYSLSLLFSLSPSNSLCCSLSLPLSLCCSLSPSISLSLSVYVCVCLSHSLSLFLFSLSRFAFFSPSLSLSLVHFIPY